MASCREEFRCSSFGLGGTNPRLFASPQARWLGQPWSFLFYRFAIAVYQLVFFSLVIHEWGKPPLYNLADNKAKWLIYMSNWTYIFITAYFLTAFFTALYWNLRYGRKSSDGGNGNDMEMNTNNPMATNKSNQVGKDEEEEEYSTPWYFKVQRYLHAYSCSGSLAVTLLYWILEFNPTTDVLQYLTLHVHGIGAILMFIDLFLIATPMRILHAIYVMLTAFVYFCFTAIYWAAGGTNHTTQETHIYRGFLDWGTVPGTSAGIAAIVVFVAAPVLHLIFYGFYRLRLSFGCCCSCCKYSEK